MTVNRPVYTIVVLVFLYVWGCSREERLEFREQGNTVPGFSAERARQYIEDQVEMGPRVPNTEAHREAIQYFRNHFGNTAGSRSVFVQSFRTEVYGDSLNLYNLVASFEPERKDRILLAAHWDTRPVAEEDPDTPDVPFPGADDGGSGVGILMELANVFADTPPPVGVDIILFDGEDYGESGDLDHYFLGSRHWGNHPPVPGYRPRFGILLDMTGGKGAVFPKEGYSMSYAPGLVEELWAIAAEFGHGDLFVDEQGGRVADDHVIVEQLTGIPMINIIHHRRGPSGEVRFPGYWHTHNDNMEIIDPAVLQAVGDVLLELIYNRIPTGEP